MLAEGREFIIDAWWLSLLPGLVIVAVVLAVNFFGDWSRSTPMYRYFRMLSPQDGGLSGLVSKTRVLPGMFAPTNQESAFDRRILALASFTGLTHASFASSVAEMRVN